jgi:hypothetical protein
MSQSELFRVWLPSRSRAHVDAKPVRGLAAVAVPASRHLLGTIGRSEPCGRST